LRHLPKYYGAKPTEEAHDGRGNPGDTVEQGASIADQSSKAAPELPTLKPTRMRYSSARGFSAAFDLLAPAIGLNLGLLTGRTSCQTRLFPSKRTSADLPADPID
jgi:hypothetical protein